MDSEELFFYFGHLDRLRLARAYIGLLQTCNALGDCLSRIDALTIAMSYSTPWENPERMARELLDGEPDPFEDFS